MKKALRVFLILLLAVAVGAGSYGIYNITFKEDSVYALSRLGSTGSEVKKIQKVLKNLGYYNGTVDGIYGTKTKKAVTSFQRDCALTADGICGPKTLLTSFNLV